MDNFMPVLPLDHPEPFAATLGVMLYPGSDEPDHRKAKACAAAWLAEPLRQSHEAGYRLSYETLASIAHEAGTPLLDLNERLEGGGLVGDLVKVLFSLEWAHIPIASFKSAVTILSRERAKAGKKGAPTFIRAQWNRFLPMAHLWGAWSFRQGRFGTVPAVGYDGLADFQSFLVEAEILRDFIQVTRKKAGSPSPSLLDMYQLPDGWTLPQRQPGWPPTGRVPLPTLPPELVQGFRTAGRPRKHH